MTKKRLKIFVIAIASLLLLSLLLVAGAQQFQVASEKPLFNATKDLKKGETEVVSEEVLKYIPQEATSVYSVVPQKSTDVNAWWKEFLLISKYRLTPTVDISKISDNIKQMTLFNMPVDENFEEEAVIILELKDPKKGMDNMGYMLENIPQGSETLINNTDNLITINNPITEEKVSNLANGKADSLQNNKEFVDDTKEVKDSLLWFNFQKYLDSITNEQIKKENPEAVKTIQQKLLGFEDNTRWVGKSNDFGKTWAGMFPSGGYKRDLQDIQAFQQAANSDMIYNEGTKNESTGTPSNENSTSSNDENSGSGTDDTEMGDYIAGPLMMVSESVSVLSKAKDQNGEISEDKTIGSGQVLNPATGEYTQAKGDLTYYDTIVTFSPGMLTNSLSSSGIPVTNIMTYTFNIKEGEMLATIDFASDDVDNETLDDKEEINETPQIQE